ncbi:hypothetical protein L7F22_002853 [Adiantum nelumboides]|nr:hypothetical protein [Adiantum nelumboides]
MAFPNFFGKQYESASNFLDDLEMAFLVSGRDEEEVKLRAFPLVLKDSAKNWFQNLEPGRKTNWETLKETFLSKYGGLDNPEHLWHRISSLHQATSRTYLTYESQFLRLWAEWEASLAEGERAPNFLKKEKFLAGLFPDLQEKVKGKFPETFEEALQIAHVKDRKLEYQAHMSRVEHPQDQYVKLRADEGQVLEYVTMYLQIVGSLIYLTISRPDLSYSVGLENQFMQLSRKPHLDVVRSDWAGSVCDRRSTNGFMFSLGSAAITWSSKKQPTIALSSTEAEYRGAAMAACEVAWLELLLGDLGIQVQRLVVIHCDNLSNIQLAQNPGFHAKTKHIEVHYHFIRERGLNGSIDLTFVRTDEQVVDIFTKAFGAEKLRQF